MERGVLRPSVFYHTTPTLPTASVGDAGVRSIVFLATIPVHILVFLTFFSAFASSPIRSQMGTPRHLRALAMQLTISATPARQPTLSERVTQRLRGIGRSTTSAMSDDKPPAPPLQVFDAEIEKSPNPKPRLDRGKGKATEVDLAVSLPSLSPPLSPQLTVTISEPESGNGAEGESQKVFLAGLPFTHKQISALFMHAKADMSLRPARFAIIKSASLGRNSLLGCWKTSQNTKGISISSLWLREI